MRVKDNRNAVILWASERDTYAWAHKSGAAWPCSTLSGRRFVACFDTNGLYDLTIDGKYPDEHEDTDGHELSAICADLLAERIGEDHPVYFVAVGQFKGSK